MKALIVRVSKWLRIEKYFCMHPLLRIIIIVFINYRVIIFIISYRQGDELFHELQGDNFIYLLNW